MLVGFSRFGRFSSRSSSGLSFPHGRVLVPTLFQVQLEKFMAENADPQVQSKHVMEIGSYQWHVMHEPEICTKLYVYHPFLQEGSFACSFPVVWATTLPARQTIQCRINSRNPRIRLVFVTV